MNLKTPKGMRDRNPHLMTLQQELLKVIVDTFEAHGAQALDTPIPELKDILKGKYGEDSKTIN